jgi:hypothetical protein
MKSYLSLVLILMMSSCFCGCSDNDSPTQKTSSDSIKVSYSLKRYINNYSIKDGDTIKVYIGDTLSVKTEHSNLQNYYFITDFNDGMIKINSQGDSLYTCIPQSSGVGQILTFANNSKGVTSEDCFYVRIVPATFKYIVALSPTYTVIANSDSIKQAITEELGTYPLQRGTRLQLTYSTVWGGDFYIKPSLANDTTFSGSFLSSMSDKVKDITIGYNNNTYEYTFTLDPSYIAGNNYIVEQNLTKQFKKKYPNKVDSVSISAKAIRVSSF